MLAGPTDAQVLLLQAASTNTHCIDLERSSSQYAYIADGSQTGLDLSGDFTLELWTNREADIGEGGIQGWIGKGDVANGLAYFFAIDDPAGSAPRIICQISQNGTTAQRDFVEWRPVTPTATWQHAAVICDISQATATQFELVIDGVSKGNGTVVLNYGCTSIYNSAANFEIGTLLTGANFFDGLVDEVRVWNTKRTVAQIAANYDTELVGNESGLVGYWKFNNSAVDATANGNDLTLANAPVYNAANLPF